MAFFFLQYLFSLWRYLRFLYYANEESNDVIGGSTKTVQHTITNICRNIKALAEKLPVATSRCDVF